MFTILSPGDPAPWFRQRSLTNPSFAFDTTAGRNLLLGFFGSAGLDSSRRALAALAARADLFDDDRLSYFGVSNDPEDEVQNRLKNRIPGYRHFLDFDGTVARLYGALPSDPSVSGRRRIWILLSPALRVRQVIAMQPDGSELAGLLDLLERLEPPGETFGAAVQAPVLLLPDVFDPGFCNTLIQYYDTQGGEVSGFMQEVNGRTVPVLDSAHKRRNDCQIESEELRTHARRLILRRVIPEIEKVHQFHVTRMERYIVGCYDAADGGHFRAHRDNTTKATAHRKFAVSINLNADFDGGEVGFPEYGPRRFKPPVGGAVVFSCSLLHSVSQVSRGRRYAFLPFLYDDAAAGVRARNAEFLDTGTPPAA